MKTSKGGKKKQKTGTKKTGKVGGGGGKKGLKDRQGSAKRQAWVQKRRANRCKKYRQGGVKRQERE